MRDPKAGFDNALTAFLAAATTDLAGISEDLRPLADVAKQFVLGGGKRLRPAFCYWAYRACGRDGSDGIVQAAAALELVHACALVHDDVIDHSDVRRGMPAAHRAFAMHHRASGWVGSCDDFGGGVAILLGDLFLVWADSMFATSGVPMAAITRAWPVYDAMRVELVAGQYLDVVEQARGDGSLDRALRVARYKAAKYTIERPLLIGAALADASSETSRALSAYGIPLGEAFQLRDDLLGVFGDAAVTGKPAGDDLREGKRTALIALALERATADQAEAIHRRLGDPSLDEDGVMSLRAIIAATDARHEVETMIEDRRRAARSALEVADLAAGGRDALLELADAATVRAG